MASQRAARSNSKVKILLLGAAEVGKTAFVVRLATRRFIGDYDHNKETLYSHRMIGPEKEEIQLEILDSANNVDDVQLETNIKWADAFILLYAVTDRQSFLRLNTYLAHLRYHDDRYHDDGPALVLVGNKADCPAHARRVTSDEGRSLAGRLERPVYELSVAESPGAVATAVDDVIGQVRRRDVIRTGNTTSPAGGSTGQERVSAFTNVKRVLKEKIYRGSRSDSWMTTPGFNDKLAGK